MKKFISLIIGVLSFGISFGIAHADDCQSTLYDSDFSCKTKDTYSYCTSDAKLKRKGPKFNIYETTYCDVIKNRDDEIYEALANQLKVEDPTMTKDKVKSILTDTLYPDYVRVKAAYENEKIISQSKASLKRQFQNSEIWYNGTLTDSPFDLIVDLNLIEIILFGNKATWQDNVWTWPPNNATTPPSEEAGTPAGQTPGGAPPVGAPAGPAQPTGAVPAPEYECVPNDEITNIIESGKGKPVLPPGTIPESCGNGKVENNETCDDGNNKSGDGCSEACQLEVGTDLSCQDKDAITFKKFSALAGSKKAGIAAGAGGAAGGAGPSPETPPINCPPGSTAVEKPAQAEAPTTIPQNPNYPGPFVGGVPKEFPPTNKTDCPPGESNVEINLAGHTESTCMPTGFCLDFESTRIKLFGADYAKDPMKKDLAAAIEASVCVDVTKVKRPESPYSLNDGCVDCHILAMDDIMAKMLEKNVTPLQNSMQSWGTSNRWGPTVSFNINILTKRLIKGFVSPKYAKESEMEKANKAQQANKQNTSNQLDQNQTITKPTEPVTQSAGEVLGRYQTSEDTKQQQQSEFLEQYRFVGNATAEQQAYAGIMTKLNELRASFQKIQEYYTKLSTAAKFQEKSKCSY